MVTHQIYLLPEVYFICDFGIYYFHNGNVLLRVSEKKLRAALDDFSQARLLAEQFTSLFTQDGATGAISLDQVISRKSNIKITSEE